MSKNDVKGGLNGLEERAFDVLEDERELAFRRYVKLIISSARDVIQRAKDDRLADLSPVQVLEYVLHFLGQMHYRKDVAKDFVDSTPPKALCRIDSFERLKNPEIKQMLENATAEERHIVETCQLVVRLVSLIRESQDPSEDSTSPEKLSDQDVIARVFSVLKLENQNVLLPELLQRFIVNDLTYRLLNPEETLPTSPEEAEFIRSVLIVGFGDITRTLGQERLENSADVIRDIMQANALVHDTVSILRDYFYDTIKEAVADLSRIASENSEAPMTNHRYLRDRLCILTYISGTRWDGDFDRYCADAELISRWDPRSRLSIPQMQEFELRERASHPQFRRSFHTHVCRYDEFYRHERIMEVRTIRGALAVHDGIEMGEGDPNWIETLMIPDFFNRVDYLFGTFFPKAFGLEAPSHLEDSPPHKDRVYSRCDLQAEPWCLLQKQIEEIRSQF